jgi:hypothetical protein
MSTSREGVTQARGHKGFSGPPFAATERNNLGLELICDDFLSIQWGERVAAGVGAK